jgi:transposase
MKKYHVELTAAEREELLRVSRSGQTSGRKLTRARILRKADEQRADDEIAEAVGTSVATLERTRHRFVAEGLGALRERPRLGARPKLTATGAAHGIAVAWSPAPGGRKRWTLGL